MKDDYKSAVNITTSAEFEAALTAIVETAVEEEYVREALPGEAADALAAMRSALVEHAERVAGQVEQADPARRQAIVENLTALTDLRVTLVSADSTYRAANASPHLPNSLERVQVGTSFPSFMSRSTQPSA